MKPTFFAVTLLFFFVTHFASGQWQHIGGFGSNDLSFVEIDEPTGICLTGSLSMYKSTNGGLTWTSAGSIGSQPIEAVVVNPTTYVAISGTGVGFIYRTTNSGSSWDMLDFYTNGFSDMASNGSTIVIVGGQGLVLKSTNGGLSWALVSLGAGNNVQLKCVEWDPEQNRWLIGAENKIFVSTDATASAFTATTTSYEVLDYTYRNGQLIETRSTAGLSAIIRRDAGGGIISTVIAYGAPVTQSVPLPDESIISTWSSSFYLTDPDDTLYEMADVIYYNNPNSGQSINDVDATTTFALAVGNNGSLGRYDLTQPAELSVIATFTMTSLPCAGSSFTAVPTYSYAHSYEWFIDGISVSTEDTLFGTMPNTPGTHTLQLTTTYDGHQDSRSSNFWVNWPVTIPEYAVTLDTSVCYGSTPQLHLDYNSGTTTGSTVFIGHDGSTTPPAAATTSNNQVLNGLPMTTSDTIYFYVSYTGTCGTITDSTAIFVTVHPNLAQAFDIVTADTGICHGADLNFSITATVPGATYQIETVKTYNGSTHPSAWVSSITGAGDDTLDVTMAGSNFWNTYFANNIYLTNLVHNEIRADITYDGCSAMNVPLFVTDVTNPHAWFSSATEAFLTGDTLDITNMQVTDYRHWSVQPPMTIMENLQDTVPLLAANDPGVYNVQLINETQFGCFDTVIRPVIVAMATAEEDRNLCYATEQPVMRITGTRTDAAGNYYEYGYYTYTFNYGTSFAIRKLDPSGNVAWVKRPTYGINFSEGTYVVSALEIDDSSNVYAWIRTSDQLSFELIYSEHNAERGYLVKWNAAGQMLYAQELGGAIVTDIEVTNDRIYIISAGVLQAFNHALQQVDEVLMQGFHYNCNEPIYGSNPSSLNGWAWNPRYPQMEFLPNGKLVVVSDIIPYGSEPSIDGFAIPGQEQRLFAALYDPNAGGFTSVQKIFEANIGSIDRTFLKGISVDVENNIYIFLNPVYDSPNPQTIYFNDSLILTQTYGDNSSFVAKLDQQLQPVWIRKTNLDVGTMNYCIGTNKLYFSGTVRGNFYFGSGDSYQAFEGRNMPQSTDPEPMYTIVSADGIAESTGMLGNHGESNYNVIHSTVSPCGDLYITHQSGPLPPENLPPYTTSNEGLELMIDGTLYLTDYNYTFKLSAGNCVDECSFIVLDGSFDHTNFCSVDDTLLFPLYGVYNTDSAYYETVVDGIVTGTGYLQVTDNELIAIPEPALEDYQIVVHGLAQPPGYDTIDITYTQPIVPALNDYYYVECSTIQPIAVNGSVFPDVLWSVNGYTHQGNSIPLSSSNLIAQDTSFLTVSFNDLNGCPGSDTIEVGYCFDLGIGENSITQWSLFPNPASSYIELKISFPYTSLQIGIWDLNGKLLATHYLKANEAPEIPVSALQAGYYLLRISTETGERATRPFMKD